MDGLAFPRVLTTEGVDPVLATPCEVRAVSIRDVGGHAVFEMATVEVPSSWSQVATDILASKYLRRRGLSRDGESDGEQGESSLKQVVRRIAHAIRGFGESAGGYFASSADAEAFEAELSFMLMNQYGAFNSPVWFNC